MTGRDVRAPLLEMFSISVTLPLSSISPCWRVVDLGSRLRILLESDCLIVESMQVHFIHPNIGIVAGVSKNFVDLNDTLRKLNFSQVSVQITCFQ